MEMNRLEPTQDAVASSTKRSHFDIALIIALAPVLAAAIRIWLYSGGDSATFLVLLRTINIPAVLIGTGLLFIPYLLTFIAVALVADQKARQWGKRLFSRNPGAVTIVVPIALVTVLYTTPWPTLAWIAAIVTIALIIALIRLVYAKRRNVIKSTSDEKLQVARKRTRYAFDSVTVLFTLIFLYSVTQTNMWLPLEQVRIQNEATRNGYVLESTSDWTTILTFNHTLDIVKTADVESRTACNSTNAGTVAMFMQGGGLENTVDCD